MARSLEMVLGQVPLTSLVTAVTQGIPDPLPEGFDVVTDKVLGNSARVPRIEGTRETAKLVMYGAPAVRRSLQGIEMVDVKCLHAFEELQIDVLTMQRLREWESYNIQGDLGVQEVARQAAVFRQRFANLRIAAKLLMLAYGKVNYDGQGNLLDPAAAVPDDGVSVDARVPAGNKDQLNILGDGNIIAASWNTASTDIPLHVRNIIDASVKLTGYVPELAIYGKNIQSYLTKNDFVKDYLSRNPIYAQPVLTGNALPSGFLDLTWVRGYTTFFVDSGGTRRQIVGDDTVIFCPRPSPDWWKVIEGSYAVPNSINISQEQISLAGNFTIKYGRFGYSLPCTNPISYLTYFGDTFLCWPAVPNALIIGDVIP